MGVGFIVGGFCPGTSIVAASTLKLDGILFVLGGLSGAFLFGETVGGYESFFLSSYLGRFTIPDWLGLPAGVVVLLVVLLALAMFWAAEILEQLFGEKKAWKDVALRPRSVPKLVAAGALVLAALAVTVRGQPTPDDRYGWIATRSEKLIRDRAIFVHPAEVVAMRKDPNVRVGILDLRDEHDFNLFHIAGARRTTPAELGEPVFVRPLLDQPANAVTFLVSNGETTALAGWKVLQAQGVANVYVIDGGIDRWLELYSPPACVARRLDTGRNPDAFAYRFAYATGSMLPSAQPELPIAMPSLPCASETAAGMPGPGRGTPPAAWPDYPYDKKVKLQLRTVVRGGCG
jgi:hypothetical protein